MNSIRILDKRVSNRIAAGEVVERPASIVKELVENSIDAQSSAVTIEIKNGGIDYIRVSDNGHGISEQDALISFERHATSKVYDESDLDKISTLGFRGEALSSIAAVAKVSMTTRTKNAETGIKVETDGEKNTKVKQTGCTEGTTLIVENIFYNIPVRRSFLKRPQTEAASIQDYILRMILAKPEISFKYINNNKLVFHSPGNTDLKSALACVYGYEIDSQVKKIEFDRDGVKIFGYVSNSNFARPNRSYQSFFVNGRYIISKMLSTTLQNAFGTRLMVGRFPLCAININLDYRDVDINIHPNKLEARFKNEQKIVGALFEAVAVAIGERRPIVIEEKSEKVKKPEPIVKVIDEDKVENFFKSSFGKIAKKEENINKDYKADDKISEKTNEANTSKNTKNNKEKSFNKNTKQAENIFQRDISPAKKLNEVVFDAYNKFKIEEFTEVNLDEYLPKVDTRIVEQKEFSLTTDDAIIVGSVFDTYILIEQRGILYMIDQHAAHERLIFDELVNDDSDVVSQQLLIKEKIDLTAQEFDIFEQNIEMFEKIGFKFELAEDKLFLIATPIIFGETQKLDYFFAVLKCINEHDSISYSKTLKERLALMSCKAAVKGNYKLSDSEIKALVNKFEALGELNCPHGRPIVISMSKNYIEKLFKRIV